jgi:hypothetical protein
MAKSTLTPRGNRIERAQTPRMMILDSHLGDTRVPAMTASNVAIAKRTPSTTPPMG